MLHSVVGPGAARAPETRAPKHEVCHCFQCDSACPDARRKIFLFRFFGNCVTLLPSRLIAEGRCARSSRHARRGCGGREGVTACLQVRGRLASRADAKSYGPDTPTLVSSSQRCWRIARMMVANKPGAPGRLRISVKTTAQGMPDDLAAPVVTAACFFFCRRAMGEAFTRHSLRPLHCRGRARRAPLGHIVSRACEVMGGSAELHTRCHSGALAQQASRNP